MKKKGIEKFGLEGKEKVDIIEGGKMIQYGERVLVGGKIKMDENGKVKI